MTRTVFLQLNKITREALDLATKTRTILENPPVDSASVDENASKIVTLVNAAAPMIDYPNLKADTGGKARPETAQVFKDRLTAALINSGDSAEYRADVAIRAAEALARLVGVKP